MSQTYQSENGIIEHVAGADITKGDLLICGSAVGVALNTIANGAKGSVSLQPGRVFTVPKDTGAGTAVTVYGKVYRAATSGKLTGVSAGNLFAGIGLLAAADGATEATFILGVGEP